MSTRASEKLRLALLAIAAVVAVYAGVFAALSRVAVWAERDVGVYPYAEEDWLRHLLPHMFDRFREGEGPHILVTGPSAVREAVDVDRLERAIPSARVHQGGISLGTIDDVIVSLEYIEGAYGADALPDVVLLGLTPRFVANLPDERPFLPAIDRYSPYFHVVRGPGGPSLEPKGRLAGAVSWLRFHTTKQTDRYRTAGLALAGVYVRAARARCAGGGICPFGWPLAILERVLGVPPAVDFLYLGNLAEVGVDRFLEIMTAPWKYRFWPPKSDAWLLEVVESEDSFWGEVFAWDPRAEAGDTLRRLERLHAFTERRGIGLVAINLPENEILDPFYRGGRYAAYQEIARRGLGDTPYFDLRRFLRRDEFLDWVHTTRAGAERLTDEVVRLLNAPEVRGRMPREIEEGT